MSGGRGYRRLLGVLPRDFRDRHEAEMVRLYEEQLEESGRVHRLFLRTGAVVDVLWQAVRLRWNRRKRHRRDAPYPRISLWGGFRQDLVFAARSLGRRPGFTGVAVLVLGLGIGATTVMFSVVNGVLLRPLPYAASDRIGLIWHEFAGDGGSNRRISPLDIDDYREWSEVFEAFTYMMEGPPVTGDADDVEVTTTAVVEAGFFDFFGVEPIHGRTIRREDDVPGAPPVAVLSHSLWMRRFGGDPTAIGRTIAVNGEPHRIIGVLPAGFELERLMEQPGVFADPELWMPARFDRSTPGRWNTSFYVAFGRIRPGVTFTDAQSELDGMAARLRELQPEHARRDTQAHVVPLKDFVVLRVRSVLVFLFVAVGLVLLVACANVAGLLLIRIRSRGPELSIRSALGAGRQRVVRLVLVESLVLAALGSVLAVALSFAGVAAVRLLGGDILPRARTLAVDGRVLLFALVVSGVAAVMAGMLPAVRAATRSAGDFISGSTRTGTSRQATRLRDAIIVFEAALSLVLLVATGLVLRSFEALRRSRPGYDTEGLVGVQMYVPESAAPGRDGRLTLYRMLEERLDRLPDVTAVAAVAPFLPLVGSGLHFPSVGGQPGSDDPDPVTSQWIWVTPGFFAATGASLLRGREFTWTDMTSGERLAIVDDRLATRAFPDGDAVGRAIRIEWNGSQYTVVGVVSHLRLEDLERPGPDQIYFPMSAGSMFMRGIGAMAGLSMFNVVLRTSKSPGEVDELMRGEVDALGPGVALRSARSIEELTDSAVAPKRALLVLMTVFGSIALLLAAVGLYGVLAFSVRQRTKEIGIRMALGNSPLEVQRLVLRHGILLIGLATLVGLAVAAAGGRFVRSFLYGVEPTDPATYIVVTVVLAVTGILASWLPARRATRIDPMEALRPE